MDNVYINDSSAFYSTLKLYRNYIGYEKPISYNRWMRLEKKFKAPYLFVQFYNEITLAWYKVKTKWSIEEEGVEVINQYLVKNVEKIEKDKKRFTPQYIYKVAYNCLYCLCIDPSKNKDRYYNETSESFKSDDGEASWFDFIGTDSDFDKLLIDVAFRDFIDELDDRSQLFIGYVLNEITEFQLCQKLKKLGIIDCNIRIAELRKIVVDDFIEEISFVLQEKFDEEFQNIFQKGIDK